MKLTYNSAQLNIFIKPPAQYFSHFGWYKRPNGRLLRLFVSLPQNVRHFLCKQQVEWLPREQDEVRTQLSWPSN